LTQQYLLGYYFDEQNKVTPVTSDSNEFVDSSQDGYSVATITPLKRVETDSTWLTIANLFDLPDSLAHFFTTNSLLLTTDQPVRDDMHHALLMHSNKSDPQMGRTGLLLQSSSNSFGWEPVIVHFKGQPFFVECKGAGTPIGGFTNFHQRTQAGTTKTHRRLTGGLFKESMESEFHKLMMVQSQTEFKQPGILPLACIGFEYTIDNQAYNLGLILRLTRSNIRHSYTEFGDFSIDNAQLYRHFSDQNHLLFSVGLRHQNLTANNLVYYNESNYVVTDYEELSSIYCAPTSLDSESDSLPLFLKVFPYRYLNQSLYTTNDASAYFDLSHANLEYQNGFRQSRSILGDYFHATKQFILSGYFDAPLDQWVQNYLIPNLTLQRDVLIKWLETIEQSKNVDFEMFFEPFKGQFDLGASGMSSFSHEVTMSMMFIAPITDSILLLQKRIKHIDRIMNQLAYMNHKSDWFLIPSTYSTPFIHMSKDLEYWDASLLLFPFLQWVTHWNDFLKRYYSDHNDVAVIKDRLTKDCRYAEPLYTIFKTSADEFIDYLTIK
jgi:hypothetical protein